MASSESLTESSDSEVEVGLFNSKGNIRKNNFNVKYINNH